MWRSGRYAKQTKEIVQSFRELARTAETLVSVSLTKAGLKPPRALRRRKHVVEALAELKQAKAAKEGKAE